LEELLYMVMGIAIPLARGAWDEDGGLGIAKVRKGNVARMNAEKYICENEWRTRCLTDW
jgi:hypothetical protein